MMKQPRKVKIELRGNAWVVAYVERRKYQRYLAATFYAPDHTFDEVQNWVRQHPTLELV